MRAIGVVIDLSFHPSGFRLSSRFLAVVAFGIFIVAPLSFLAVGNASAEYDQDLWIFGTVYDSGDNTVEGASVVVLDDRTLKTYDGLTDEFGQYEIMIPSADWLHDDIIEVTATYGDETGDTQGIAPSGDPFQIIMSDIHMSTAIPEFGSGLGSAIVAAFVGVIAIVMIGRKPRNGA